MLFRRCFGMNKTNDDDHLVRRLKTSKEKSIFEILPNELILIIFEYLYYHDIINAFHQLNDRFQYLLYSYRYYHLNISDIKNFPFNIEHIKSLTLSNTNINIELFYPKLQSLSILDIDNNQLISFIFFLPNFQQLNYLSISKQNFNSNLQKQICYIILFKIKSLKYFKWNINNSFFDEINLTSFIEKSNIEYYKFYYIYFSDLVWLKFHTRNLKSLHIFYPSFLLCNSIQKCQTFERLISIKLTNVSTIDNVEFLFEHLTYLIELKQFEIQGDFIREEYYIDGYKWKYFIQKYIPQLKIFKFFFILSKWSTSKTMEKLIEPFRTEFWLKEKHWFITCNYRALFDRTYIYTIPSININENQQQNR